MVTHEDFADADFGFWVHCRLAAGHPTISIVYDVEPQLIPPQRAPRTPWSVHSIWHGVAPGRSRFADPLELQEDVAGVLTKLERMYAEYEQARACLRTEAL